MKFDNLSETSSYYVADGRILGVTAFARMENAAPFALKVDRPGLYFIALVAPKADIEVVLAKKAGGDAEASFTWCASRFLYVP